MRLIAVTRAEGYVLARDLPATRPHATPLLRTGARITERYARHLIAKGINAIWVEDELSEGIMPTELIPESVRQETADRVHDALTVARSAHQSNRPLPASVVEELSAVVDIIARNLADTPDAALALSDLAGADSYTHRHSVNVTALGLLIARECFRRRGWTDYRKRQRNDRLDERMALLGMGLLLHDLGKMAVPREILLKPAALSPEEWEIMRGHPDAGVALLNKALISPLVISVVRDHHERWDGSGYPRGIVGDRISQFARIAAIADVYDAVTSERPYKEASPAWVGVKLITDGDGTDFDPELVEAFRRVVFPYPVGTELRLPDGRVGVVASVDPDAPNRPTVRVASGDSVEELRVVADGLDGACFPDPAAPQQVVAQRLKQLSS